MPDQDLPSPLPETAVIIVGAGPAGAAASVFLSKAEVPHILLEKKLFPRDKVCGDAVSGKSLSVLKKANPAWLGELFSDEDIHPCHGIKFVSPDNSLFEVPFKAPGSATAYPSGFITPRLHFDDFLFRKTASAYATVYQQADISNVAVLHDVAAVSFTHGNKNYLATAQIIIGADGDKGIVRKSLLQREVSPKAYVVGLRAYYEGITGMDARNQIELYFLPELSPGYLWIFPLTGNMANVGVGMPSAGIRQHKINLREAMLEAIKNNPLLQERFANAVLSDKIQGWGLPVCLEQSVISGERFMLTGDAASLIDPFSGEGIGNALYSGMTAANAATELLKTKEYGADSIKALYDDKLYKSIGDELKLGALLQRVCKYPRVLNFLIKKASKSPSLKSAITAVFTGANIQNELRKPAFYLRVLFNK